VFATTSSLGAAAVGSDANGIWKWTTEGRNRQPEETVLVLKPGANGILTGTLTDRGGPHALTNVTLNGINLSFTILRDTPDGKAAVDYTLKLDDTNPKITIERPDPAPAAKRANKKRIVEHDVVKTPSDDKPKG
jgi:hypothetical protein